jgi:hypothetical protein
MKRDVICASAALLITGSYYWAMLFGVDKLEKYRRKNKGTMDVVYSLVSRKDSDILKNP